MNIELKFKLRQEAWFMKANKAESARVTQVEINVWWNVGQQVGFRYHLEDTDACYSDEVLYTSKAELLASL